MNTFFQVLCMVALVCGIGFGWANHTQVVIYSQDIPDNLICRKDTYPEAYLCRLDEQSVPWYLSPEGTLADRMYAAS